jgi:hypothetical protein
MAWEILKITCHLSIPFLWKLRKKSASLPLHKTAERELKKKYVLAKTILLNVINNNILQQETI